MDLKYADGVIFRITVCIKSDRALKCIELAVLDGVPHGGTGQWFAITQHLLDRSNNHQPSIVGGHREVVGGRLNAAR